MRRTLSKFAAALLAAAIVLIKPGIATDLVGAGLIPVVLATQLATARSIKLRNTA